MKKHLVAYGDENYRNQRENFKRSALESNFFDKIHLFSAKDLDADFTEHIYKPIKSFRGGGYWIWKPYFVKKVLDEIEEDDIMIYCDAGCMINQDGKKRFDEYMDLLVSSPTGSLDFSLVWREYQYTKQEVFQHFRSSTNVITSLQLHSTVLLLKKCEHTRLLVDRWYDSAIHHPFLFTDEIVLPQYPEFIDHRHDQSIFSVIRKTFGATIIPDEICYGGFDTEKHLPFWSTRFKG